MATKKSASANKAAKKKSSPAKKETPKKPDVEKTIPQQEAGKDDDHLKLETITVQAIPEDATDDFPEDSNCTCRQKKQTGNSFALN